eukprot:6148427-Amphidinium_carterae.1
MNGPHMYVQESVYSPPAAKEQNSLGGMWPGNLPVISEDVAQGGQHGNTAVHILHFAMPAIV